MLELAREGVCMGKVVTKHYTDKFEVDDRALEVQANQTIKGDPVLALVELITNADDAYLKMEESGLYASGRIVIRVVPRRSDQSIYEVFDNATGMDDREMLKKVKRIGADVSGLTEHSGGRSYFGRGLKECMIAFGKASIKSIKDGIYYEYSSQGVHLEDSPHKRNATSQDFETLNVQSGSNGTLIQLFVANDKIKRTPQFSTLARSLQLHYSLRDILQNPRRSVFLQYGSKDFRGIWEAKEEKRLTYSAPKGTIVLKKVVKITGFPATATLEVFRATQSIPDIQEKYASERGFIVASKNAINDVYDFGFGNQGEVFGRVTCQYFDHLLRVEKDSTWLNASRDGIKWRQHEFCNALELAVVHELAPIFKRVEQEAAQTKQSYENAETRKRVKEALEAFNKIAREELEDLGHFGGPIKSKQSNQVPPRLHEASSNAQIFRRIPNGFAFTPSFVRMNIHAPKTITLSLELSESVNKDAKIELTSNMHALQLDRSNLVVSDFLDSAIKFNDGREEVTIVRLRTQVSAETNDVEGTVTAKYGNHEAKLEVIVQEKSSGSLFSDYEFDPNAPKEQRVQFIRATGLVRIATSAPSIINYFGPNGEKQNSKEAKVLLAELILYACCAELVRLKIGQEGIFLEDDPAAISELIKFRINEYKDKFAETIHYIIFR